MQEAQRATQELEARLRQQQKQRAKTPSTISQQYGRSPLRQHPAAAAATTMNAAPGGPKLGGSIYVQPMQRRQLPVRRAPLPPQRGGLMPHGGLTPGGAPILSVGFNPPSPPPPPQASCSPSKRVAGEGPVPVAPPLPRYRGPISQPTRDAAERAWRAYAAPEARRGSAGIATPGRRSVGKLPQGTVVAAAAPAPMRPHYRANLVSNPGR